MISRETDFAAAAAAQKPDRGATGRVHECLIAIYEYVVSEDFNYIFMRNDIVDR
jgi:hypothetical protein